MTEIIISELERRKAEYVNRYKELYARFYLASHLSDEAKGRYYGRFAELSYILIDVFGMTGREINQIEQEIMERGGVLL